MISQCRLELVNGNHHSHILFLRSQRQGIEIQSCYSVWLLRSVLSNGMVDILMVECWGSEVRSGFRFRLQVNELTSFSICLYISKSGTAKVSTLQGLHWRPFVCFFGSIFLPSHFAMWPRKLTHSIVLCFPAGFRQWRVPVGDLGAERE